MHHHRAIKYLYDGDCSICRSLKALLERQDGGKGRIVFVNIASSRYDPEQHAGIAYEDAMASIHAIRPNGEVLYDDSTRSCTVNAMSVCFVHMLGYHNSRTAVEQGHFRRSLKTT